jgi:hypothetical protein
MTGERGIEAAVGGSPPVERPNYTGAIYGSLLAASVVVGAGASVDETDDYWPLRLAVLLAATGLVFWLAHWYARLVGDRIHHAPLDWHEVQRSARHEWPLFQAAMPPAAAALVVGLTGASNIAAAWAALAVALVGQVGWATFAISRAGASRPLVLVTALVNLGLGVLIVILKAALHH